MQHRQTRTDYVRLNVGGTVVVTTRSTLTSCANSMLAAMFGPNWESNDMAKDDTGAIMLDSDVRFFMPVLNFLRRGELVVDASDVAGVLAEAKFYGVEPIVKALGGSSTVSVKWSDIGGLEGVKRELQEVVGLSVQHADMFERCGVSPSKNLLLYGPPGCGKTLLAKAAATEIRANFVLIKCAEFVSSGADGDRKIQERFTQARALQPCVVYLEEFEAIAHQSHDSSSNIVNQMAICLDEISCNENVFVMAATNRPDLIEPVLLRPGRFDQLIYVPLPTESARREILDAALAKAPLHADVRIDELAVKMDGLSGADLLEICKRACKFAIRESIAEHTTDTFLVHMAHFERALKHAKRSVAEGDLYRYERFIHVLKQISNPSLQAAPVAAMGSAALPSSRALRASRGQ